MRTVLILACVGLGTAGAAGAQSSTATGVSRDFNPAISVNTLLVGRVADATADRAFNGADLQEAEVQFTSIVDPYWKADLVFAVHPERGDAHGDGEETDAHGGYAGDVEVARLAGLAVPGGFGLVVGKDYLPFGKHVPLHTHQYAFVDAPAAVQTFLGAHGLTETGVRLSHDLPLPWYSDLTAYGVDGRAAIFQADSRDFAWGARWSNLLDLSLESTLEVGGSWLRGPMAPDYLLLHDDETVAGDLQVWGADVTWKWVSAAASRGPALTVTGELILPRPEQGASSPWGWYAQAQYRFKRNWWLGVGAGGLDRSLPHAEEGAEEADHGHGLGPWEEMRESKLNLTWTPSEFSAVRLEAARFDDLAGDADDTVVSLQFNFTIGSHPAHLY
ncbi:MAG: hypothetical protein R6X35_05275 [Candidatus Krumholzibacteriia bacterium]